VRLKKYSIPILICVLGCMLLVAGCGKNDAKKEPASKTVTVTDCTGRSVEITQPLEKVVVLNPNAVEAMRILKVQDKVIGVSNSVQKHSYLGIQNKDLVGSSGQPNYEKIVELRPQIVITYGTVGVGPEIAEKLEPAGVKVVLLDFYKPGSYDADFKILAKMFGKEKEAEAFLKWKAEQIAILDKAKDIKAEQRLNVFTIGISSFEKEEWKTRASGTATHQAIEMAGLINVAQELKDYPIVSPEWILQHNPGVLFFIDTSDVVVGFKINDLTDAEKFKEKVIKNKVLSKTDAVQKDRIHIITEDILGGNKSYLGALYMAKWFYPTQFKDLDPEKVLKEYFEKWLDIPFQGKWVYPPVSK
jgi:iron complex transport system substrate-binding protein